MNTKLYNFDKPLQQIDAPMSPKLQLTLPMYYAAFLLKKKKPKTVARKDQHPGIHE